MKQKLIDFLIFMTFLGFILFLFFSLARCGKDETEKTYCPPKAPVGQSQKIKLGEATTLGEGGEYVGVKYLWFPVDETPNPRVLRTVVQPKKTTVYLLKAWSDCGTSYGTVKVEVIP